MGSPFMFGVCRERLSKREVNRRQRIARKHGATFVYPGAIPGSETRGWFECPNRGEPFNEATAKAVLSEVKP